MKLNTRQAADKLGTTTKTVTSLIQKGLLHDIRVYGAETKRKNPLLASAEVNAFAKQYKPHRRTKHYVNGSGTPAGASSPSPSGLLSQLVHKLDAVEAKVDRLLKIWS